jgi:hypothetical protein
MQKYLLLICISFLGKLKGQDASETQFNHIRKFVRQKHNIGTIWCKAKLWSNSAETKTFTRWGKTFVTDTTDYIQLLKYADSGKREENKRFIMQQIKLLENFQWTRRYLRKALFLNRNSFDSLQLDSIHHTANFWHGLHSIEAPTFTLDYQYCQIRYYYYCGNLCGGGQKSIYKRIGKRWKKIKTLQRMAS